MFKLYFTLHLLILVTGVPLWYEPASPEKTKAKKGQNIGYAGIAEKQTFQFNLHELCYSKICPTMVKNKKYQKQLNPFTHTHTHFITYMQKHFFSWCTFHDKSQKLCLLL